MLKQIKKSTVQELLPQRKTDSHKGDNGAVLIIGGSIEFFGAPILSGLGALHSGADLVRLYVPESNFDPTRANYPDFIVKKYPGDHLTSRYIDKIIEYAKRADAVLIGPGLHDRESTQEAVLEILKNLHVPTILDAQAIQVLKKVNKFPLKQPIIITPHRKEFQNLVDKELSFDEEDKVFTSLLRSVAMDLHINILLKGPVDFVCSASGELETNSTGNPGMTVGGTGDVLAGVVSSFIAQGATPFDAIRLAAYFTGKSGDLLYKNKSYYYSATEVALNIPLAIV